MATYIHLLFLSQNVIQCLSFDVSGAKASDGAAESVTTLVGNSAVFSEM